MTIKVGEKLPDLMFTVITKEAPVDKSTDEVFAGRKVVLIGLPGAFTPVCTTSHIPGYLSNMDSLKEKGVEEVVVLSVNDVFVMKAWAEFLDAMDDLTFIADHSGEFVTQIGLEADFSSVGLGVRSGRWSMLVEDGVVQTLNIEPQPTEDDFSGAACMIEQLGKMS